MTSLTGSPSRGKNPFIERYMANLGSNSDVAPESAPPITPVSSPVRSRNVAATLGKENDLTYSAKLANSPKKKTSFSPLSQLSPSKQNSRSSLRDLEPKISKKTNSNRERETFDISKLSGKDAKYYEFLCRAREAKEWIEEVIEETLPSELELVAGNGLRDGVYLAKVTQKVDSSLVKKIVPAGKSLQFTHTQNINAFFHLVEKVGVPDLFRFELTDLYEKKNIPKVFETLHALINVINSKWPGKLPEIQNLSGMTTFSDDEIKLCQRKIPTIHNFRSFKVTSTGKTEDFHELQQNSDNSLLQSIGQTTPEKTQSPLQHLETPKNSRPESPLDQRSHLVSPISVEFSENKAHESTQKASTRLLITDNTPLLTFDSNRSPAKSLSYYSPRIYRHLSYRSNLPSFRFAEDAYDLDRYDTYQYKAPEYSPVRKQRMTEVQFLDSVSTLQAICRGVNTRFGIIMMQRKVDIVIGKITLFQAQARARVKRKGIEARTDFSSLQSEELLICNLQSILKAKALRETIFKLRLRLITIEDEISCFQHLCRSSVVRLRSKSALESHTLIRQPLRKLQAHIKGRLQRSKYRGSQKGLQACRPLIENLQALLRAHHLRKHRKSIYFSLNEQYSAVIALQAYSKGSLGRAAIYSVETELQAHNAAIMGLAAALKGSLQRRGIKSLAAAVRDSKDPVASLQALSRGILVRFTLELIADIVEASHLCNLQALARGSIIRDRNIQLSLHYETHKSGVIKIQASIRRFLLRRAYLEFMSAANPSVRAVKKFVHLLSKIHANHESRNKLEFLKSQIDQFNGDRDRLEEKFELLKRKNAILSDYNIFVSHSFPGSTSQSGVCSNFPEYEKLLYLLQTDPFYWVTLHRLDPKFAVKHLSKTFVSTNNAMGRREAVFFIKLVAEFLATDIESSGDPQQFLTARGSGYWKELLFFYVSRQMSDLIIQMLSPLLDFLSLDSVDFESTPAAIYRRNHPHDAERSSSDAIEDEKTKNSFVTNLTNLWTAVELVSETLLKNAHLIPEEIKFLCTTGFKVVANHSPYESDALIAISRLLIEAVVAPVLEFPAKFGLSKPSSGFASKAKILLEAVNTVFCFLEFEGYLTPLNQYTSQIKDDLALSLKKMLTLPSFEAFCDRLLYIDMCQDERPTLSIPKQYLVEISQKLDSNLDAFPHDDAINPLVKRIRTGEKKLLQATNINIIELRLNPSAYQLSSSDDRLTSIYNEIKRGLVYMMQVEDVETNLYDLMTGSIIDTDEPTFQKLLHETAAIQNDPLLNNLEPVSYFNLKQHVLERAYELRQMGNLSIDDKLQTILNDIANTIKSREYVVESTTNEIKTAEHTLKTIQATNAQLEERSRTLEQAQKRALNKAQMSTSYTPVKKHGLSRKIKDVYHKVNNKNANTKDCLSFEWNTRRLFELDVLKDLAGENLGKAAVSFFGSSGPKFPDVTFRFSTSDGEYFAVELIDERKADKRSKSSTDNFQISKLLDQLAKNKNAMLKFFSGTADVKLDPLLELIITSFIKRTQ
ncbi:LAME_0B05424g1_1 [Lachancea meyersii CBS 8951]|uniref:LAME_0B05424g1_1 n=1 Tax=Lachancea meyersii CBS 8951 TaxID=1266667 RepID=A0A1G4IVD2_9SACH|nr:LAME_0B05424g1_1 [Lachancea meyersii CBS 8951]